MNLQVVRVEAYVLKSSEYVYFEEPVKQNEACFRKALEETKIKIL